MLEPLFDKNNIGKLCSLQNENDRCVCLYAGYHFDKIVRHYWFLFLFDRIDKKENIKIGDKEIGIFKIPDKELLIQITTYDPNNMLDYSFNLDNYNSKWISGVWFWEGEELLKSFSLLAPMDSVLYMIKDELV